MSDSLVYALSRSGEVQVVDPDDVPHTDDLSPLMQIAVALFAAGYTGIAVDELKLSNGRFIRSLDADLATPEGRVIQDLWSIEKFGGSLPAAQTVLDWLQLVHRQTTKTRGKA